MDAINLNNGSYPTYGHLHHNKRDLKNLLPISDLTNPMDFFDDLGNGNNNIDSGRLLHHNHHHHHDDLSFKHYPVFIHKYKTAIGKSLWPDIVMTSLPTIFILLLTTPMLMSK
ncbi:hypothetical protein BLA29_009421 [Euroglyphus maynei]|uniref:Uncharacterized protein n=1 Tax=Euroglyphus maynei TaxID=6958 RepID=A0A1Y3B8P2_EURMA|nr:hypothetical protein BLA29_009421 [Euroglyphus maynei]